MNMEDTFSFFSHSIGQLNDTGLSKSFYVYSQNQQAICLTGHIDVPIIATPANITLPENFPADNFELTEFIMEFARREGTAFSDYSKPSSLGPSEFTFDIFVKLCIPDAQIEEKSISTVQFLTHGGTLDNTYWDFAPDYSYVDAAAEQGYATFSYDRLGSGQSEHPDPIKIVQAPLQVDIAHALIHKLKAGDIGSMKFSNVIGIGHSLGSAITQGVSAHYPDDFDAIIVTGHSGYFGGSSTGFAAAAQQIANTIPGRTDFKNLPNGYITNGPIAQAIQFPFYYYPYFDKKIFDQSLETRQTNALGETLSMINLYTPSTYKKPVQILNGIQDFFYCHGNCLAAGGDVTADALSLFYPERNVAKSQAVNIPNVGHNINFHFGRTEAFEKMLAFVSGAGITP